MNISAAEHLTSNCTALYTTEDPHQCFLIPKLAVKGNISWFISPWNKQTKMETINKKQSRQVFTYTGPEKLHTHQELQEERIESNRKNQSQQRNTKEFFTNNLLLRIDWRNVSRNKTDLRILTHQEAGRNNRANVGVEATHYTFPFWVL